MNPLFSPELPSIALGFIVLLAGRNIFWLVIGVIGFLVGIELGELWLANQPFWFIVLGAALLGALGAVLAILFERLAFALAGFYAAIYVASVLFMELGYESLGAAILIIVGVGGALIAAMLMDSAIIVLSALAGSAAVVSSLSLGRPLEDWAFVGLALLGVVVQYAVLNRRRGRQSAS